MDIANILQNCLSARHQPILSWSSVRDIKSLVRLPVKIQKIEEVLKRYHDLRSVNLFTVDAFQNKILARTTIELDADIITIIPPELLIMNQPDLLMKLHSANICLANYLFLYPMTKIFVIVKTMKNILRVMSIPLWIVVSMIIFPSKIILNDYLFTIINFVVVQLCCSNST